MLKIENLTHQFRDGDQVRVILDNINYEFERGKLYAILGHSGSGKTTLVSLLCGLDEPTKGQIYVDGQEISSYGHDKYRRNKTSIVFQQYNLIEYQTALDNIMTAFGITENELPTNKKEVALNLLNYVGIVESKANRKVNKLSGGEQQRVAIARSLATNVDLIFADEPTGNLDTETETEIIALFKSLAHEHNKTIIIVTHTNAVASESDICLKLDKGVLSEYDFAE